MIATVRIVVGVDPRLNGAIDMWPVAEAIFRPYAFLKNLCSTVAAEALPYPAKSYSHILSQ